MILRPQIHPTDSQEIIDYYLANYSEVHVLICDGCHEDIGIEVRGNVSGLVANSNGYTVIPIGSRLLASRIRLDGMCGYQCICGNDTRVNEIEEKISPSGAMLPHEVHQIHKRMNELGYRPKIKHVGKLEHRESFILERVK